ncbi:probable serine/threonine-protein kinase pats1 [Saccostrea cucullata]|uniref:probable serine/threonine-protein kinase pats1 n=1 Tax=Saccostrea cuccullata TaxID=36930 RepID=UPI002ED247AA
MYTSRCLLYSLLFLDEYTLDINEQGHKEMFNAVRERYFNDLESGNEIKVPAELQGIVNKQETCYMFKSEEVRQNVMYAFVTECLVEDSDLEFFLRMASKHVVSEYCRSWNYEKSDNEKCLYIPDKPKEMYDLFIDNLQVDILVHCFMSEKECHSNIRKRLNIPEEIFSWDIDARKRFVEISRGKRVEMFHARGMIVGCAGAGKTTLLENLKRVKRENEPEKTETTVGLDVHEDLFEIIDDKLEDFSTNEDELPVRGIHYESSHGKKLISMTDFAGQVAYYSCHQVYLSRRAFYLIVIDMSKDLKEKVCKHNVDRHNPKGSLFRAWRYKDYFHFWLQSIKTYCDEGNTHPTDLGTASQGVFHPVILVASHKDKQSWWKKRGSFFGQLNKCLSESQTLKELISPRRYFEVECPGKTLTNDQEEKIEEVRNCIVETVKQLPHWGEKIPLKWANLEEFLRMRKEEGVKVIKRQDLKANGEIDLSDDDDLNDALRFFHEIGQLIYFSEKEMKNVIVINVQWFVDGFKYIITDETHLARKDCNSTLIKAGKITGKEIEEVWRKVDSEKSYIHHKQDILPYLDKLGLMTKIQSKDNEAYDELYYIPSMNRIDLAKEYKEAINGGQKTSIILFHFKSYLPHFFFFRLVVKCLHKWKALNMEMFCKNAAFYKMDDAGHYIVIAVNKTSIQLQVFTPEKGMDLQTESAIEIRETVKSMIHEITQTFHRQTKYEIGYTCKDINITEEDEEFFLTEEEVKALKTETGKRRCPKHIMGKQIHDIDKNEILRFWWKEDTASSPRDNHQIINESE